jgi:soluble lytic murein transglycosylase-like protein
MIKTLIVSSLFITPAFVQISTDAQGHTHFTRHKVQVEKKVTMVNNQPIVTIAINNTPKEPTLKDINRWVHNACVKYSVDEKLVHAIIKAESTYRTEAVSSKGAVGLMQLMPATAERFGVEDRTNVKQNIEGGIRFIKFLMDTFKDKKLAVAGYNAGEHAVMRHNYKVPPYPETIVYVDRVITEYERG